MIGGATRKIEVIWECEKGLPKVAGSSQSNFTPMALDISGVVPLREATRLVLPFEERSRVIRLDIFPVPPVNSMEDIVAWVWL